ncbi:MAG TPA: BTAD domain-containing putative transcriptional regulator, partial [Roseiflexaceae bacterium]|nr:BTAD domain-containing putative transcriptional regulator [Roseiflexaceae bacterium]
MLRISLFGAPCIELDGRPVQLRRTKALALLAYLALARRPQERDTLVGLLWPEFDDASARNNLRRELSLLRSTLDTEVLVADRTQVSWNPQVELWLDVAEFEGRLAAWRGHGHGPGELCTTCAAALADAARLYTADLLAGFDAPDCPAFDEWLFFQREELRQQLAALLPQLAAWHAGRGEHGAALGFARRWLALDPLHEPAQREVMRLYALAGQQAAALRQYEECVRLLEAELEAEPEAETRALYEEIRARRLAAPAPALLEARTPPTAAGAPRRQRPFHNLPAAGDFVGRQRELADVIRRLTDPACRLLTLTGPGGVGKTRLALQAAQVLADTWRDEEVIADGVLFVPLAEVSDVAGLISALAAAAHFEFYPSAVPRRQILDYLRDKRMLLVLDNFEQLLDAAEFIGALVAAAPGLRLLVTSRVALNLPEEWFHPVEGLSFPTEDDLPGVTQLARYDAVRLFEQHARRARIDFSLSRERAHVVRLCRLVAGMPLAIELAAAWLRALPLEQVVAALERSIDILTARDRATPERHRSMRTVLEQTWRLLSPEEQPILAGLSVFHGGFTAQAAAALLPTGDRETGDKRQETGRHDLFSEISGFGSQHSALSTLAAFVEKSLLRVGPDGRFQMHELLRQFAAEQLAADPAGERALRARHSAYYLDFLAGRESRLRGHDQRAALGEITCEGENLRAAWRWAVEQGDAAAIDRALASGLIYCVMSSRFQEGEELFSLATQIVPDLADEAAARAAERVHTRALLRRAAFRFYLGDYEAAVQDAERGLATADAHDIPADVACANITLGAIAGWRGDAELAHRRLERALAIGRAIGDQQLIADALHEQSSICGSYGDYAAAQRLARESLAVSRAAGQVDWSAHALLTLGWATTCLGEYADAEAYFRESQELFEQVGSAYGAAMAEGMIGWVAWCVGGERLVEARERIERSMGAMRVLG